MSFKEKVKPYFEPIADGLFGKQRGSSRGGPQLAPVAPRPIGQMMEDLLRVDEESWGTYAFSRDPLNRKFTPEKRLELTQKANACGREYAQKISQQYGTSDPTELAKKMGMLVEYPEMPKSAARVLFAEYKAPNHMYLYMDAVRKARTTLIEPGVKAVLTAKLDIGSLLLAHELFHYVEETNKKEIFTRTEKVELWAPKPLHNRSTIGCLGEIAAMEFARTLTDLPYSPYLMDVFLVYGYSQDAAVRLYEEIMGLAGQRPSAPETYAPAGE